MSDQDGWKGRAPMPAGSYGPLLAMLGKASARLDNLETRSALTSASISSGGLTVKDGGGITVRDGGTIEALDDAGEGYARLVDGHLEFEWGGAATPARMYAGEGDDDGRVALWIYPPRDTGSTDPTSLYLEGPSDANPGGASLHSNGQVLIGASTNIFANANTYAELTAGSGGAVLRSTGGAASVQGASATVQGTSNATVSTSGELDLNAGTNAFMTATNAINLTATGAVFIKSGSKQVSIGSTQTGGASANCVVDATTGLLYRSTSSLRYKQDVEDYTPAVEDVLKLRPRTFRTISEVAEQGDTAHRYVGYIAEEVAAAGLVDLVIHDDQGRPDALSYDRMLAAYHAVIVAQQQTITDLTTRVTALEDHTKEATP